MIVPPLPYHDGLESVASGEAEDIERTADLIAASLRQRIAETGRTDRDVHAKAHGSASGKFSVLPNLPSELAQGLFARPAAYDAIVRFSNSAPLRRADLLPDARGMAIQVERVEGNRVEAGSTQDLVMANHPVSSSPTLRRIWHCNQRGSTLRARDRGSRLFQQARHSAGWVLRSAHAFTRVLSATAKHPADYAYFSMVPIRFGDYVAKYRIVSQTPISKALLSRAASLLAHKNAMRHWLETSLQNGELRFWFQVQLRTSDRSMPVEDATVEWPERESSYQTVAALVLPMQTMAAASGDLERRSYSVWNCLVDHRPLGGLNRVRRKAYETSAAIRS